MGYMRHHAIVVTDWNDRIHRAHAKAVELGMSVSNITDTTVNGHRSFLVAPDGSKEGWGTSNEGDEQRALLIAWLDSEQPFTDWVEVQYGDDDRDTHIVDHSDTTARFRARNG